MLLDRFFLSTYAYQIAGHGLPDDEVRAANRFATGGLSPDLTLLFAFPVEAGLARAARRPAALSIRWRISISATALVSSG